MFEGDSSIAAVGRLSAGFTLVELLVVMVVGAILLAIAVPSLQGLFAANQLTALTDTFATSLSEARSEASKFGVPVAMVTTGGTNWGAGWTMFVDTNANGQQDAGQTPPEITLRSGSAMPTSYTMAANGASAGGFSGVFWFDATGRLLNNAGGTPAASAQFQICQGGGPPNGRARLITVSPSGRVRIAQNNASGQPLDDNNNAVTTCP
jgi:type IV fimbrial biogenesis protein FimT